MAYTISSTERTRKSASDHETKALIYLMGCRTDSPQIFYFVVDFFNDLTGVSEYDDISWDVQSKASTDMGPNEIGKSLVTLYKNYLSSFSFSYFIAFLGGVSSKVGIAPAKTEFDYSDIAAKVLVKIKKALKKEAKKKTYIDPSLVTDSSIDGFVEKVHFVLTSEENHAYVKKLIFLSDQYMPSLPNLQSLFIEIKSAINKKKDNILGEGLVLTQFREFHNYNKFLTADEIKLFILNRIVNGDITKQRPTAFDVVLDLVEIHERDDFIFRCRSDIYRLIFNKNNSDAYWKLLEVIFSICSKNMDRDINEIFDMLPPDLIKACQFLKYDSTRFFIALIKEKLNNDN